MEAFVALLVCSVFAYALTCPLKKAPVVFYIVFALVGALFASGVIAQWAPALNMALVPFLRRAPIAFGLFTVVMFIGVFPDDSPIRKRLAPIRGVLSLLAFILVIVHVLGYVVAYWTSVTTDVASPWIAFGFIMGVVTLVLLVILSVTSVSAVHKAMDSTKWQRVQKLAYPFYLLMYVHLAAMLLPSSLSGGNSLFNLAVYTIVMIAYVALRLLKASRAKRD